MCKHGDMIEITLNNKIVKVDHCLAKIITTLNAGGMPTVHACCGHGEEDGYILGKDYIIVIPKEFSNGMNFHLFNDRFRDMAKRNYKGEHK